MSSETETNIKDMMSMHGQVNSALSDKIEAHKFNKETILNIH